MKIEELLSLEWVGKKELFEMAISRKAANRFISSLGGPIVDQFLKLTYLNSPNNYRHWMHDGLNNYLIQIRDIKLKPNNTRPEPDLLYSWLFDDRFTLDEDSVKRHFYTLRQVKYKNLSLRKEFNTTEAFNDIQHLFNPGTSRLLHDISLGRFKTIEDYYSF